MGWFARRRAQDVGVGVGRHERCLGEPCYVPESFIINVRKVDQTPSLLHSLMRFFPASVIPGPVSEKTET